MVFKIEAEKENLRATYVFRFPSFHSGRFTIFFRGLYLGAEEVKRAYLRGHLTYCPSIHSAL